MKYLYAVALTTLLNLTTYALDDAEVVETPLESVELIFEAVADELKEMSPLEFLQLEVTQSEKPLEFDQTTFYDYVVNPTDHTLILNKPWFLIFYSPKCPHCVKFKPTWNEFHNMHKDEVNVGSVDCKNGEGRPLCSLYDVNSYPSLKYISLSDDGTSKVYTYSDTRNQVMLEKFALQDGYTQANWKEIPHEVGI